MVVKLYKNYWLAGNGYPASTSGTARTGSTGFNILYHLDLRDSNATDHLNLSGMGIMILRDGGIPAIGSLDGLLGHWMT